MLVLSSTDLMALFDLKSPGTLTKWKSLGAGRASCGRNRWDARKFLEWWLSNIYEASTGAETDGSLAEARRGYWQAKAERERMTADREKGKLIDADEAVAARVRLIGVVTSALDRLPARISAQVAGKTREEARRIIDLEATALREVMAAGTPYCDQAIDAAIGKMGGITPQQAVVEKVRAQSTMPVYMTFDPYTKQFTDARDGTLVPLAEAEDYVRRNPYKKTSEVQNDERTTDS